MKTGNLECATLNVTVLIPEQIHVHWHTALQVGSSFALSAGEPAVTALYDGRIAFVDYTNDDLRTYDFNGQYWSLVGNDLYVGGVTTPALATLGDDAVAFIDSGQEHLRKYTFSGSQWSQVGTSCVFSGLGRPALAALGPDRVALVDDGLDLLTVYDFDGDEWTQVGSSFSISSMGRPALTALSSAEVAFMDPTSASLRTYEFNGVSWALAGTGLTIATSYGMALTALNDTDVVYATREQPSPCSVYRFDRTTSTWSSVSPVTTIEVGSVGNLDISAINGTDFVFFQERNDELRLFRFGFSLTSPHRP